MFVKKLKAIKVRRTDTLVSFDVKSLFTKVPLDETIQLLSQHLDDKLIILIRHVYLFSPPHILYMTVYSMSRQMV